MELPDRLADRYRCYRDRKLNVYVRRAGTGVWLSMFDYTPPTYIDTK